MTGIASIEKISSFASSCYSAAARVAAPMWKFLSYDFSEIILPRKCVTISIEDSEFSISFVTKSFSKFKVRDIKTYQIDLPYPEPEHFASTISLAISELKADKSEVILSIPKSWVIIKTVEFPASVKENIANVLSYEMDRITPFTAEEAFYDFRVINETEGKIKVLLAAARSQLIQPYFDALAVKGIIISKLTLNISGIETLINYIDGKPANLYLEINDKKYEGASFCGFGCINFFAGEFNTSDDKEQINQITKNLKQAITGERENALPLKAYILFRNKSATFKEIFKTTLNIPFKILDEIDTGITFIKSIDTISYHAIGGALETLWGKSKGLNLLTKGHKTKEHKPLALTIILLIILVAIGILYIVAPLYIENKKIEEIDRQIQVRKDEVKKIEALKKDIDLLKKDIDTINSFKMDRHMTLNILKEFTSVVPKGAWLTRLRITEKAVEIEGYASSATDLLPKLEASGLLQKVEFASPTFRDARMNMDRFNIKMELEEPKK